jgi:hypothetical protein
MDKLYDLMIMGLKYQTLCVRNPADIMKVSSRAELFARGSTELFSVKKSMLLTFA